MYWGLLAMWCAFMAYLVVVKRLHYQLAEKLNAMFFGEADEETTGETVETTPQPTLIPVAASTSVGATTQAQEIDAIDNFIYGQIFRVA